MGANKIPYLFGHVETRVGDLPQDAVHTEIHPHPTEISEKLENSSFALTISCVIITLTRWLTTSTQGIQIMAVTLRLTRCGGKKSPHYRVVAADERSPRDGRLIEQVGIYDPRQNPPAVTFDMARVDHWLANGAVPSETVGQLIKKAKKSAETAQAKA
jgi:small subunit ribosomal protein S16